MREEHWPDDMLKILTIVLVAGVVIEGGLWVFAYLNADRVECNWLWCTFTDVKEQNHKQIMSVYTEVYSECYVNGHKVHCNLYKFCHIMDRCLDWAEEHLNKPDVDGCQPIDAKQHEVIN